MTAAPGRPLTPIDPAAGAAAALGAAVRKRRLERGLTLAGLGVLAGYSTQHLSDLERGKASVTRKCVAALDGALDADGALLELLKPAMLERAFAAQDRAQARVADTIDDVEPTSRRGLIGAGAAAALGGTVLGAAPVAARDVDPELPAHWIAMLAVLGRHAEMFGAHDVLDTVRRELHVIAEHRAAARGELRIALMRVEARWAAFAAWLCHHAGDVRGRGACTDRVLRLAHESDDPDMVTFVRARQSKFAGEPRQAVTHAEAGLCVAGASSQTRAWCARYAALGHARTGDTASCERRLHDAYAFLEDADSSPPPWAHPFRVTVSATRAAEARCWLELAPARAVGLYEDALRDWPRAEVQHGGIEQARLALACAKASELDRAKAEGAKALAIYKQTRSATAARELKRLQLALNAA